MKAGKKKEKKLREEIMKSAIASFKIEGIDIPLEKPLMLSKKWRSAWENRLN